MKLIRIPLIIDALSVYMVHLRFTVTCSGEVLNHL